MYRVGGDSKPEELTEFLETYDIFREWVKAKIICIFEVYYIVAPNGDKPEKRQRSKSVGDYNLTEGTTAIKMIKAYLERSGMSNDTKIQGIINDMEYKRC